MTNEEFVEACAQEYQAGYEAGYNDCEVNKAKPENVQALSRLQTIAGNKGWVALAAENAVLKSELGKCEEQYNKLWEYTQEKHKQISKLTAERDAAVADLKRRAYCGFCSHFNPPLPYIICLRCERGSEWQWRGLSLAAETSDKEEEHE